MTSLESRASRKRAELMQKCDGFTRLTMTTKTTATHYIHRLIDQDDNVVGNQINVPLTCELKSDILPPPSNGWEIFFRNLGCLTSDNTTINMIEVNKIKK